MSLIGITTEELQDLIALEVNPIKEQLAKLQQSLEPHQSVYMDYAPGYEVAAKALNRKIPTIKKMVAENRIPYRVVAGSRQKWFSPTQLKKWLATGEMV